MLYKIYQLKQEQRTLLFRSYDEKTFDINNYNMVYVADAEFTGNTIEDLDNIYCTLNANRPDDFKGHSLSVSDIVELDGSMYYVERFGWKKIS